jgi:hypothetical protein
MKLFAGLILLACTLYAPFAGAKSPKNIKQFIFFSRDREKIHEPSFYNNAGADGAQITYAWKRLEPKKGVYDFSEIEEDLNFLASKNKKLFIQIQDVTFYSDNIAVPKYLLSDPEYHGGVAQQCVLNKGKQDLGGWYARRWDTAVAERFHLLLRKLAEKFDGAIEGINLPETAIDMCDGHLPDGFTNSAYVAAIKENMKVARDCFEKSVALQYANFMSGGATDLKQLFDYAKEIKMGMGGPDILVYRPYQMENSYPLIRDIANDVVTGMAVQEGNYAAISGKSKKKLSVQDILGFARNYFNLDYIFWCTEEPYYSKKVLPMLQAMGK